MGNTPIASRHNPVSVSGASSSPDERTYMTRPHSEHANKSSGLKSSTQADETTRYLPKAMKGSSDGVNMPSKPNSSSNAGGMASPQWGWYINITPPTPDMYHSGSPRPLHKTQDSSATDSQASTRYLPKGMNPSNDGVIMPSRPYGSGGPSYYSGSRPLHKNQDSSANASQATAGTVASEATSHQPNRIFKDMHTKRQDASMGWSSVPL